MKKTVVQKNHGKKLIILSIVLLFTFVISFGLGRYPVSVIELIQVLLSKVIPITQTWSQEVETVIFNIRFPRIIASILVGAALASAGATYQGLFQNPMASPDLLGASAGAGFGAALAIVLGLNRLNISILAFVFSLATVFLVWLISTRFKGNKLFGLILTGIMVGSLFSAGLSMIQLLADPNDQLPAITYWLMGSLASIRKDSLLVVGILIAIGFIPLLLLRWRLNVMTLGEEEARAIGVNTAFIRLVAISSATLLTATSVSVSGIIGWVGLVIPHFARMFVGSDYRVLIPTSMLLGGSFLLIVDNFSRLIATQEIPLGILTAFIGAPFFMYLFLREDKRL